MKQITFNRRTVNVYEDEDLKGNFSVIENGLFSGIARLALDGRAKEGQNK